MDDEPSLMTTEVMLARMRDFSTIGVSQTAGLIMGGVFATAAVSLTEIMRTHDALPIRLSGWLYGVTAALMVLDGLIRRTLLEARPIFRAVPLVALGGLLSMVAFAMLGPLTGGADGWRYSQLVVFAVGVLFAATFGGGVGAHVEPALQPIYDRFEARGRRRRKSIWYLIILGLAPFGLAMADRYGPLSLRWPIVVANLALSGLYVASMIRSHRYYDGLYAEAFAAHVDKLAQGRKSWTRRPKVP